MFMVVRQEKYLYSMKYIILSKLIQTKLKENAYLRILNIQ